MVSTRSSFRAGARAVLALGALALAGSPGGARAEAWREVFAAELDTAVFLGADGSLLRAPFGLETGDLLWRPRGGQHVVRFRASPDGRRVAWLTRAFDEDTTRLWISSGGPAELKLRFFALLPAHHRHLHSEPDAPSTEDERTRGARLILSGAPARRPVASTLEWTADGRGVVVGFDGGVVQIAAEGRAGFDARDLVAAHLAALHPSPMFLVDALSPVPEAERPRISQFELDHLLDLNVGMSATYSAIAAAAYREPAILSPAPLGWRVCRGAAWTAARVRTAGARALWWARGGTVWALRPGECAARDSLRLPDEVAWLGFDEARGEVLAAAGRALWRWSETGGSPAVALEAATPIRAVVRSSTGGRLALSVRDSVLVWSPADGTVARLRSGALEPCELIEGPEGQLVVRVDCGPGLRRQLARADLAAGRLVPIETPNLREGRFASAGRGAWILLFNPGGRPPRTLHAYDVRLGRWHVVDNPGIAGWEALR